MVYFLNFYSYSKSLRHNCSILSDAVDFVLLAFNNYNNFLKLTEFENECYVPFQASKVVKCNRYIKFDL